jgi:hypothetical protein
LTAALDEPLIITQIRSHLPNDWKCTVEKQEGKKGHPHGLDEPVFRADFSNPHQTVDAPRADGGKAPNPLIPLYFYNIHSKARVMEVIDKERIYSWDIPIYFGETEEYIVVTSPAYVNHGIFTKEAKKSLEPMWEVLRKYIKNKENTGVDELAQPDK